MQKELKKYKSNELVFTSKTANLAKIRSFIRKQAISSGFSDDDANNIVLAVDEACTNLIRYSFNFDDKQKIRIDVDSDDKYFIINIMDKGRSFNPLDVPKPNMKEYLESFKRGGLGIYLIRTIMDEIDYLPSNDHNPQNTLILKKLLV